jgi:succinate dehydrogenase hydrophobic anchor subunit
MAMTCGAISTHMVVCGFTVCEMFKLEYTTWRYRIFTLVPAIGILGVVTNAPLWLPVAASAICLTMLPIAYIAFFIMNNKRSYIGDAVGHGWKRVTVNAILLIAIAMATIGSAIKIKGGVIDKIWPKTQATQAPAK